MDFNYGFEKKRFDARWKKLAEWYAAAGMDQAAIDEIKMFDWKAFKGERVYRKHNQSLNHFETDDMRCPMIERFLDNFSCPALESDPGNRYGWIDEIEDGRLYALLKKMSRSDVELITLYAFDGYTVTEIANLLSVAQPTVSKKINRIKNFLEKFREEAMD